jgi:hypothetical protein
MSDNAIRESLLQQNPTTSVALKMLHDLMEAENRRVRWLTACTWVIWSVWLVSLLLYVLLVVSVRWQPAGVQPVVWPIWLVLVPLAVVGTILLILQFLARRSATLSQLRVSVAAIDEQLKLLSAARGSSPTEPKP